MKINNVKFEAIAQYSNGEMSKDRWFCTEKALSNWANAQFRKDEGVTVTVWHAFTNIVFCIYHA